MYKAALANADTGGGVLSLLNPEGKDLLITFFAIDVTTVATAACTLDAGTGATATIVAENLIDGIDVNTAAKIFTNHDATTGENPARWESDQYLTISMKTGAAAGLAGNAYIKYTTL